MTATARTAYTTACCLVLAAACGGEARSSSVHGAAAPATPAAGPSTSAGSSGPERTAAPADDEEPALPSHRKLRAFLPDALPGYDAAQRDSDRQVERGHAAARGRYQASLMDFRNAVEVEISYSARGTHNPYESLFRAGLGQRTEIAGFPAVRDESEFRGETRQEIYLRLSPELWIQASGPGSFEDLRDALGAIDLAGLAEAAADGSLFEESAGDRIERTLRGADSLAALLPERIGPLEARNGGGTELRDTEPMHDRATAFYGSGSVTLFDYADPDVAASVDLATPRIEELRQMMGRRDDLVDPQPLEVAGGEGTWVVMDPGQGQAPYLVLHLTRGRLAAEYAGSFVASGDVDESLPAEVRAQILAASERQGAGAFSTLEEQRDAVVAAFEAIDPDELSNGGPTR